MKQRRWPIIVLSIAAGLFLVYSVIATVAVRAAMDERDDYHTLYDEVRELYDKSLDERAELIMENAELEGDIMWLKLQLSMLGVDAVTE